MPYALQADLEARYLTADLKQVTSQDGLAIDAARVTAALGDASAEIDTWVGRRYVLPLAVANPDLTRVCCDIAMYRLQTLRTKDDIEDSRQRYADAMKLLKDIACGEVELAGATLRPDVVPVTGNASPGAAMFGTAAPVRDWLRGSY